MLNVLFTLVCLILNLSFFAFSAHAQEAFRDELKAYERDDIHSIHKKLYTKEGRHEFSLGLGGILNSNSGYGLVTAGYQYHLFENLAIEAGLGGYGFQFGDNDRLLFYQGSVVFAPLYGKVSLFTWAVVNFDIYVVGGAGVVNYSGRNDGSSFMGNVGAGERFFINEFLSAKIEYRDLIYNLTQTTGESKIQHNHTILGSLSILIPFTQKY